MDFAAIHIAAQDHHHAAVTVICAEAAIFGGAPPKLGHGDGGQLIHVVSHIGMEGGETFGEVFHQVGHQSAGGALREVRIPAAEVNG